MWPRVVEVMFGCWLVLSPFIFRHAAEQWGLWLNDMSCGAAVVALALLSWWPPCRRAHLAIIGVGLWLVGFGYLSSTPPAPPASQNEILVGVLLLMFAILPSEVSLPPRSWRQYWAGELDTDTPPKVDTRSVVSVVSPAVRHSRQSSRHATAGKQVKSRGASHCSYFEHCRFTLLSI